MFIDINQQRINIYAPYEYDGVRYPNLTNPEIRTMIGITEIPDPPPPDDYTDETYFRTELSESPYVVYTKKPDEMLIQINNEKIKQQIIALESTQHRAIREATLTGDNTRLQALDDTIAALRAQLV